MKFRDFKIGARLATGFSIVISLILCSLVVSIYNINILSDQTTLLYRHPFTVTNTIKMINIESERMRRILNKMVIFPESHDSLIAEIDSSNHRILSYFPVLKERYLGDKQDLDDLEYAYSKLAESRFQLITAIESDDVARAKKLLVAREELVKLFEIELKDVLNFANNKAKAFYENSEVVKEDTKVLTYFFLLLLMLASGITGYLITRGIRKPVDLISKKVKLIEQGEFYSKIDYDSKDELGSLARIINQVSDSLGDYTAKAEIQNWQKSGINSLNDTLRGEPKVTELADKVSAFLSEYTGAFICAFYVTDSDEEYLTLAGGFAISDVERANNTVKFKEGLTGECAASRRHLHVRNVKDSHFFISSATGKSLPSEIFLFPLVYAEKLYGIVELGKYGIFSTREIEFLLSTSAIIGAAVNSSKSRESLTDLLMKTQQLAEELQVQQEELRSSNEKLEVQQEELRAANEELEEQTTALKFSEERLKSQQEELEVINEELEEKNESLQKQKADIQLAREELEIKAEELAIASKYKSEFLANMSHELRTPLNSLLILSKMLGDNKKGNLTEDEVESAEVIYRSGSDLLNLINEILDLSKIEAGKMELHIEKVPVEIIRRNVESTFKHSAAHKGLEFDLSIGEHIPDSIETDKQRLEQILKNLISNAIKFTKTGKVTVRIDMPKASDNLFRSGLNRNECVAITVADTGIGIPLEKQKVIFEAFQQADGGTSREFGGTGLGLSISRELSHILGGEIQVESIPGTGSSFTLFLPLKFPGLNTPKIAAEPVTLPKPKEPEEVVIPPVKVEKPHKISVNDDRKDITEKDKVVLIIEDDPDFAKLLLKECKEKNLKAIVALTGYEGLELALRFLPMAILLDLGLPDINGIDILTRLKESSKTRHIPVHIVSGANTVREALNKGAIGYLAKPVAKEDIDDAITRLEEFSNKKVKDILLIEDDINLQRSISRLIGDSDVKISTVETGSEAIELLADGHFDLMILDLGLPDMTGFELLQSLEQFESNLPPVIVYTGRDLSKEEDAELRNYADSIIIKGVRSEERLLDETSLFLHRLVNKMPENKKRMILDLHETDQLFRGKKVLIVDDDMRNVFALSKLLSDKGMNILKAENGRKAIEIISSEPDIDLVIMDIMMPEMDGYETIRRIREKEEFYDIPIIAVTAKAMKKDYQDCIAAGASDYLPKPVDIERLFSIMRVWLYR
ncbi:MAG: response regulator [Bacteroidetes bacterium]|nr:response regulator [Bacteroidota bacterium]